MRKKSLAVMSAALVVIVISQTRAWAGSPGIDKSKPVEIKLKFPKGRTRFIENVTAVEQAIQLQGQTLNQTINSTTCYREAVRDNADGVAKIELQFDRMAMNLTGPGMSMSYDTDTGSGSDQGQMKPIFDAMLHKPMEMTVTSSGDVKSFTGLNAIRDDVTKSVGTNLFWPQMKNAYNNDAAKVEYGEARFQFVPNHPVAVGDTWSVERKREMPGFSNVTTSKTDYTLSDVKEMQSDGNKRRVAVIDFQGTMKADSGASTPESAGGKGLPELKSGTRSGTIWFDLDHGEIIHSRMKGETQLTASNGMGKMNIDVTLTDETRALLVAERDNQRKDNAKKHGAGK